MGNRLNYEPSEQEIVKQTARIRKNWSEREYRKRAGLPLSVDRTPPLTILEDQRLLDIVAEHNLEFINVKL